jgi:hypothetical protein
MGKVFSCSYSKQPRNEYVNIDASVGAAFINCIENKLQKTMKETEFRLKATTLLKILR